jgi:hypothetical protein
MSLVGERIGPTSSTQPGIERDLSCAALTDPDKERRGVLVSASQSEREEETRD